MMIEVVDEKSYPNIPSGKNGVCVCVCVDLLKRSKTCRVLVAGASGSSYLPDATKLWYDEGWVV